MTFLGVSVAKNACRAVVVGVCISLVTFSAHAQAAVWPAQELENYVTKRWLGDGAEEFARRMGADMVRLPSFLIEITSGRALDKGVADRIDKEVQTELSQRSMAMPPNASAQKQFNSWKNCLARSYAENLSEDQLRQLSSFADTGVFEVIPKLREATKDLLYVAVRRSRGIDRHEYTPQMRQVLNADPMRQQRLMDLMQGYLGYSDSLVPLSMLQSLYGYQSRLDAMAELMLLSEEIPQRASAQGISAAMIDQATRYAKSPLIDIENKLRLACFGDKTYAVPEFTGWVVQRTQLVNEYLSRSYPELVK